MNPSTQVGSGLKGATVVLFESRRTEELSSRVAAFGGTAVCAPSVREVPLRDAEPVRLFGEALMNGRVDACVFMTGFGVRLLIETLSVHYEQEELLDSLRRVTTLTRGPKPAQALREYEVPATITVPEPATWEQVVETLRFSERSLPLEGKTVAIIESGVPNARLGEAIRGMGAAVMTVPLYRWALPEDLAPLHAAIDRVIRREAQFLLFTNATQVRHVLRVVAERGQADAFREACRGLVVASVGPLTSRELTDGGLRVDFQSSHPRMSAMIVELAGQAPAARAEEPRPSSVSAPAQAVRNSAAARDSLFLRACRREPVDRTPVWIMRQAGRFMKAYRELRGKVPFIDLCKNPDLVTQVTVMAVERLGVDAAILFSDLLLIVEPMGLGLEYVSGDGPIITGRLASRADVDRLREVRSEESLRYVFEGVRMTRRALRPEVPLIGFCGAPFTLAAYMIEGGGSRSFTDTKRFMWADAGAWHALMEKTVRALTGYINGQIAAGADAVQIFDSWVGCLSPSDYRQFVLPHTQKLIRGVTPGTPVIHFGTGTAAFLKEMREAGGDVIGVDFRVELDAAWRTIGHDAGIQGNLDPSILNAPLETIRAQTRRILDQAGNRQGHIFNLGHGVQPDAPEDHVIALVDIVHELSRR